MRRTMRNSSLIIVFLAILALCCCPPGFAAEKEIYIVTVSDAIGPGIADFIETSIEKASAEGAACIIIQMDTPGGLAESMRVIVKAIFASRVPVVVYVAPSGARAASAGVMITMAADIAAMAPGTAIGAAHPVDAGGKDIDGTMSEKVTNDMAAQAKSIAERRGRNAKWAEKAVRESVSVTETEALKEKIVDMVAPDLDTLIRRIDGKMVEGKGVLKTVEAKPVFLKENLRTKILKTISDPNIAYILMMIGLAGLYFELSHPGAIFPGVIGGISLVLAFFAFQTLPVNYAGILLIILSLVFFIIEMKVTSYGLLSFAGILALLLGSIMLFEGQAGIRLSWRVLLPTIAIVSGFFMVVAGLVFRSQISRPKTGSAGMVGQIGVAKTDIAVEGKVFVNGELWKAVSTQTVPAGEKVRVRNVVDLVLEVEPLEQGQGLKWSADPIAKQP